ncbi:anti-sigma F factor [Candidatus Contubernalis alkaliaceticus]|uniref:anti-sigma F factor n=1 Tax=Candidatus Contubernalis alkaliaceticus TaxID=338645 RepID=UPI001F4C51CB|nr:anti-sigma F factor [Candidatus Contubernalis alkalaceticus]UNC92522.1 anti-sigma F factor [Candidatus Contubernalis alkalaceticus]
MKNIMKLEILSKSQNESFARIVVAAFASQLDPTLEEINEIKTAVSEAVTNAVIHAYPNKTGLIVIKGVLFEEGLEVEITDSGIGIENVEKAREPLYTTIPDQERSGMGFTLMEKFMDGLEVLSEKNKGTTIKMTKRILNKMNNYSN